MRTLVGVGVVLLGGCTLAVDLDHFDDGPPAVHDAGLDVDAAPATPSLDGGAEASTDAGDAGPVDVTAGLVGRWSFNETSGTVAADTSGQSNAGAVVGATWTYGPVPPQGALAFDGNTNHVAIGGSYVYATSAAAFSFSAWFYLVALDVTVQDIMQIRSDTSDPWHVIVASHPNYAGISLGSVNSWVPIKTGAIPSLNTWHHVAVIYDGHGATDLGHFAIYLDGASQPVVAAAGYGTQTNTSVIGATDPTGNAYNGRLREVRIYNRALAADEVATLFAAK